MVQPPSESVAYGCRVPYPENSSLLKCSLLLRNVVFFRVLGTHVLAVTRTGPICKRFAVTAHHFYKYLQPH